MYLIIKQLKKFSDIKLQHQIASCRINMFYIYDSLNCSFLWQERNNESTGKGNTNKYYKSEGIIIMYIM